MTLVDKFSFVVGLEVEAQIAEPFRLTDREQSDEQWFQHEVSDLARLERFRWQLRSHGSASCGRCRQSDRK